MNDLISRQAAIRWVKMECNPYGKPTLDFESGKKVIKHLKQMPSAQPQRWIPVTERLPEYGIEVVTVDKDGDYEINHIIDEEDGKWYWRGAIAWMPLPECYREGESDG